MGPAFDSRLTHCFCIFASLLDGSCRMSQASLFSRREELRLLVTIQDSEPPVSGVAPSDFDSAVLLIPHGSGNVDKAPIGLRWRLPALHPATLGRRTIATQPSSGRQRRPTLDWEATCQPVIKTLLNVSFADTRKSIVFGL